MADVEGGVDTEAIFIDSPPTTALLPLERRGPTLGGEAEGNHNSEPDKGDSREIHGVCWAGRALPGARKRELSGCGLALAVLLCSKARILSAKSSSSRLGGGESHLIEPSAAIFTAACGRSRGGTATPAIWMTSGDS